MIEDYDLVEGAGKAQMLWNVTEAPYQPDVWPSQLIQARERGAARTGRRGGGRQGRDGDVREQP